MTGHAHHFLSRLDRTTAEETALALSFYRDPALLRSVLELMRPDPAHERVAISLGGDDGPHVIVTRDARFITCLERGMEVYDAAQVSRADLEACAGTIAQLREAMGRAAHATHDRDAVRSAFTALFNEGDRLAREPMDVACRVRPLMVAQLLDSYQMIFDAAEADLHALSRRARFRHDEHPRLRITWKTVWAASHLMTLVAEDSLALSLRYAQDPGAVGKFFGNVSFAGALLGTTAATLRGAWAAARMGPACVDAVESLARSSDLPLARLGSIWALVAMGVRHPSLAERVSRCLEEVASAGSGYGPYLAPIALKAMRERLDGDRAWEAATAERLRGEALSSWTRQQWEGFDDDAVLGWHANVEHGLRDNEATPLLGVLVPWYAAREASMMCHPEAIVRRVQPMWSVSTTESLLGNHRVLWKQREPSRAAAVPGRNDACSCGSGRKYKRCCG